jgi:hypothetical protein
VPWYNVEPFVVVEDIREKVKPKNVACVPFMNHCEAMQGPAGFGSDCGAILPLLRNTGDPFSRACFNIVMLGFIWAA